MGTPEPVLSPRRDLLQVDAWIVATLTEAADWIVAHGGPAELSTMVRIAALELERFYAAGLTPDRDPAE